MSEISTKVTKPATWLLIFYLGLFITLKSSGIDLDEYLIYVPICFVITLGYIVYYQKHWNLKIIFFLFFLYVLVYSILVAGVRTGLIFGPLRYGGTLGPGTGFFGAPLFAGCFWSLIIYCLGVMVKNTKYSIWIQAIFAAFLLLMFDVLLEPVAMKLQMWGWEKRKIPFFNYIAWFLISYPIFVLMLSLKAKLRNDLAPYVFLIMTLFFLFSNLY